MIQDRFINVNIEERYIDKAKNLAPVGYELHTLKVESIGNYNDAPSGMTTKEYEQKIIMDFGSACRTRKLQPR